MGLINIVTLCVSVVALFLNVVVLVLLYKKHKVQRWTPMDQVLVHSYVITSIFVLILQVRLISKLSRFESGPNADNAVTILGFFLGHINERFQLVISLQRFIAVFFPLRVKSLVTRKKTRYLIIVIYTATVLYYTAYAVTLLKGMMLVQDLILIIGNSMVAAEVLFCVLLYSLIFIQLKLTSRNNILYQGGEQKKLVRSSVFCCVLMITMVTSISPLILHNFGANINWETMIVMIWVDPVFSGIWYVSVMRNV